MCGKRMTERVLINKSNITFEFASSAVPQSIQQTQQGKVIQCWVVVGSSSHTLDQH